MLAGEEIVTQEWIIYLVIALIFLILVLVGAVLYLGMKILKNHGAISQRDNSLPRTRVEDLSPSSQTPTSSTLAPIPSPEDQSVSFAANEEATIHYCLNHPSDHASGVCAICQNAFCDDCIKEHEGHSFCESHFRLFLSHEWDEIDTIKTTPDIPESALPLYDFKQQIWREKEIPSILSTHYKINIEGDFIESYVKLVVRKEEFSDLLERYNKLKQ